MPILFYYELSHKKKILVLFAPFAIEKKKRKGKTENKNAHTHTHKHSPQNKRQQKSANKQKKNRRTDITWSLMFVSTASSSCETEVIGLLSGLATCVTKLSIPPPPPPPAFFSAVFCSAAPGCVLDASAPAAAQDYTYCMFMYCVVCVLYIFMFSCFFFHFCKIK